ncbi:hypothetical protein [Xylophilus sp.]|uniref:hypothetical protein n=1 Tax=Xylophilus sp. TaxID=2653893 RepID=UPI0013BB1702|nr:hypothetical protein [Xylophilus sp.]KAF1045644.1 MAG: hypothetical protein GAK38_02936 [Xylophilus sp.]
MKGMHPTIARTLAPFAPPANDSVSALVAAPFEIETERGTVIADPRDVEKALSDLIDGHMEEVTERVIGLTKQRLERSASDNLIDRHAA